MEAVTGKHLALPIQRQIPAEALRHDPGDEGGRCHPALDHPTGCRCLDNARLAATAGIFRAHGGDDAQHGGYDVDRFADILADAVHGALAAGALRAVRLDDLCHTREMLGQATDVPPGATPPTRSRAVVIRCVADDGFRQIAQIKTRLVIQDDARLLRTRAEQHRLVAVQQLVSRL
jgi:hypothetical protein